VKVGLFTGLLTLPLAPVRGAAWLADQLAHEAERRLYDEDRIRAELLALEFEVEEDGLSPAEVQRREDELLDRLAVSQARRGSHIIELEERDSHG
jgi:hypothetical protein